MVTTVTQGYIELHRVTSGYLQLHMWLNGITLLKEHCHNEKIKLKYKTGKQLIKFLLLAFNTSIYKTSLLGFCMFYTST